MYNVQIIWAIATAVFFTFVMVTKISKQTWLPYINICQVEKII